MKRRRMLVSICAAAFLISLIAAGFSYNYNKDGGQLSLWMTMSFVSLFGLIGNSVVLLLQARNKR
ncbi:hypothetical protein [Paenibacillus sp. NPDC058071]|uniref:hypothetical protein n=1 Tax=Paenibacillus sp. NPDC058071 TaxID=3346326 RepID=UPI0036D7CD10